MMASSFLYPTLLVTAGGAIGALSRFAAANVVARWLGPAASAFPFATLAVNVLGSFLMGMLAGWAARHGVQSENWQLFLGVGLLGGFTTFSTFSLELVALVERGAPLLAAAYAAVSLLAGVGALWLALHTMRSAA